MYALNVLFCGGFSPKLHTSTLAAILYTFVTQTNPPINKLAIVISLRWQKFMQMGKKASLP